jgi:hypothetical protein
MSGFPSNRGDKLQREWNIPALQTRFRKTGDFYMPLERWPGALADQTGYIIFPNEKEMLSTPSVRFYGEGTNNPRIGVTGGISKLNGYVRKLAPGSRSK